MNAFFKELRHARVYRVAGSYAVVSWLILQLAAIVSPALGLPAWTLAATIGVLLCGFTAVLWVGWLHDRRVARVGGRPAALRSPRHHLAFAVVSVLPAVAVATGFLFRRRLARPPAADAAVSVSVAPAKSIAVLPFVSLSPDPENAYFATGIQDEILMDLARIADLKVISRTSVMVYASGPTHNVREIGLALGVAHVLEGTVQRAANRVRVTAQLIDARTDTHLWAEHLDGDLADIFAIQTQMAEHIVSSLSVRLSPGEKTVLDARPTSDPIAYDLYLQAKQLVVGFAETPDWRETLLRAVRLLDEATARDSRFTLAWCLLAKAHGCLYSNRLDPTPVRLALEENAIEAAMRVDPKLGESHLARAVQLYHGLRDDSGARAELALAGAALPNNAEVLSLTSYLDRRAGRWDLALREQQRAVSLDPRNPSVVSDQTVVYDMLRLYREEVRVCRSAAAALPASANYFRVVEAAAWLAAGQTAAGRAVLDQLPADYDINGGTTFVRVCAALYDGRPDEASRIVAAYKGAQYPGVNGQLTPRGWLEALVARAAGDPDAMRAALTRARDGAAAEVAARPRDAGALAQLGLIDAGLGRKEDALREGRHAAEMQPITADAMDGPGVLAARALICAWCGEPEEAMRYLQVLSGTPGGPDATPGGPDFGQLRFDPAWASLRARPDYQAMLARLDPHMGP